MLGTLILIAALLRIVERSLLESSYASANRAVNDFDGGAISA